ncbi:MAG: shikimate dehydrogenase [Blautia sp.]|nr:shikimate dehydrogenase [Blautia sp.]
MADTLTISGNTRLTALLGHPVRHSLSPLIHNEAFRHLGLDYVYLCFDVTEDTLPTAVDGLKACGIRGFNLTMPNKTAVIPLLDQLSPAAKLIGAVNTVVCEDGRLIGHNTDGIGCMRAAREEGLILAGKEITLLGAGGAATAIAAQAALDSVKAIHVVMRPSSRFLGRMQTLAKEIEGMGISHIDITDQADTEKVHSLIDRSLLLINASSVGMTPAEDQTLLPDLSFFRPGLAVMDIIYNPRQTRLLRDAAQAGCLAFNGISMLLYQGAEAFLLWTGQQMPVERIRKKLF